MQDGFLDFQEFAPGSGGATLTMKLTRKNSKKSPTATTTHLLEYNDLETRLSGNDMVGTLTLNYLHLH